MIKVPKFFRGFILGYRPFEVDWLIVINITICLLIIIVGSRLVVIEVTLALNYLVVAFCPLVLVPLEIGVFPCRLVPSHFIINTLVLVL